MYRKIPDDPTRFNGVFFAFLAQRYRCGRSAYGHHGMYCGVMPQLFLRLVLGNDSAGGAGIAASAAIQAGSCIDDVLGIALRDSASGASISARAAADTSVSNLVCHGSTSIRICKHIVAQSEKYASPFAKNKFVFPPVKNKVFINCFQIGQRKSKSNLTNER